MPQLVPDHSANGTSSPIEGKDQSELLAGDSQLSVHRQRRKPNVDSVEKGNDEKQEDKRKNPDPHFLNGSGRDGHRTVVCLDIQDHLSASFPPFKKVSPAPLVEGVVKVAETLWLEATPVKQLAERLKAQDYQESRAMPGADDSAHKFWDIQPKSS